MSEAYTFTPASASESMSDIELSIIIPVFRNQASLPILVKRIELVLAPKPVSHEIIFIDDASDDHSWSSIQDIIHTHNQVHGLRFTVNRGQHAAVLHGLHHSRGKCCIVMDADLQDPPEAIPLLLETLHSTNTEVVFAGRVGHYQSTWRMMTSRLYRSCLLKNLTKLPAGAGMYFVITRSAVLRLLALSVVGAPMVIGMIAAAQLSCAIIPVQRSPREYGRSAYSNLRRLYSAFSMLRCALFSGYPEADPSNNRMNTKPITPSEQYQDSASINPPNH